MNHRASQSVCNSKITEGPVSAGAFCGPYNLRAEGIFQEICTDTYGPSARTLKTSESFLRTSVVRRSFPLDELWQTWLQVVHQSKIEFEGVIFICSPVALPSAGRETCTYVVSS